MIILRQKTDYDCDVLITGGGPAGSALAFHLAKSGMRVIVAEAENFPRDKVCGDGISPIALAELHHMGITKTRAFRKANEIDEVGLFIKRSEAIIRLAKPDDLPFHARIIPRMELDSLIYEAAKRAGADYYERCRVTGYKISKIKVLTTFRNSGGEGKIVSRVIVGADGSRSVISRQLKGSRTDPAFQLLGLRAYYEGVEGPDNRVDVYFSEENFPGIYWMFPKGHTWANVGMAMIYKTYPQKPAQVRQLFENHLRNNSDIRKRIGNGRLSGKIEGWPITFYDPQSPVIGHRLMLVGEAAGLINPLSGDGIQYSLLSARWAAECLLECFKNEDFSTDSLCGYRRKLEGELSHDFALSNLMVHFARNKALTPVWMALLEVLISRAKTDQGFAEVVAGIFEGTYPSYKALTPGFIGKVLLQAAGDFGDHISRSSGHPEQLLKEANQVLKAMRQAVRDISEDPKVHSEWLKGIASGALQVSKHSLSRAIRTS